MAASKLLQLSPIAELTPYLSEGELVALNVGPDLQIYAVIALNELDYRYESSGGSFAKIKAESPQSYRVIAFKDGNVALDLRIINEEFNVHDIQPLPNHELLLVCSRSYYNGPEDFDKNGRVYSSDGKLAREILLGDGIQSVQTTSNGVIWTSFFDEGVFGNYGWNNPVGASGLVAWDSSGNKLYEYQPTDGLDSICDCYALNVESDASTWVYYYTEFPLVHLRNQQIVEHWQVPIAGSNAFAVSQGMVLFSGDYNQRDTYHLLELGPNGSTNEVSTINLIDPENQPFVAESVFGRFNALYLFRNSRVYRFDIELAATT